MPICPYARAYSPNVRRHPPPRRDLSLPYLVELPNRWRSWGFTETSHDKGFGGSRPKLTPDDQNPHRRTGEKPPECVPVPKKKRETEWSGWTQTDWHGHPGLPVRENGTPAMNHPEACHWHTPRNHVRLTAHGHSHPRLCTQVTREARTRPCTALGSCLGLLVGLARLGQLPVLGLPLGCRTLRLWQGWTGGGRNDRRGKAPARQEPCAFQKGRTSFEANCPSC